MCSGLKVVVVDDDPSLTKHLEILFDLEDAKVECFNNPDLFIEAVQNGSIDKDAYVIMDYSMPSMNGVQAIRTLRGSYPDRPVVVMFTGNGPHIPKEERDYLLGQSIIVIDKDAPSKIVDHVVKLGRGEAA